MFMLIMTDRLYDFNVSREGRRGAVGRQLRMSNYPGLVLVSSWSAHYAQRYALKSGHNISPQIIFFICVLVWAVKCTRLYAYAVRLTDYWRTYCIRSCTSWINTHSYHSFFSIIFNLFILLIVVVWVSACAGICVYLQFSSLKLCLLTYKNPIHRF